MDRKYYQGVAMADSYASDFTEIPATLAVNAELRSSVERLVKQEPIPGKVLEGGNRLDAFRSILLDLIVGRVDLHEAYRRTGRDLPRTSSPYSRSNLVFAEGWEERLVRTQLSRFYNQAVMEKLRAAGHDKCFVAHSTDEDVNSRCSRVSGGNP